MKRQSQQAKRDYINKVHEEFQNAENHGNGGSWHYPVAYRKAYNVKMHSFGYVETLRKHLTDVQNEYYTDDDLQSYIWIEQEDTCHLLIEDLTGQKDWSLIEDAFFAGRSGGWCEVQFAQHIDYVDEDTDTEDVEMYHKNAEELDKTEAEVEQFIKEQHEAYNKYVDSEQYYEDLAEQLETDEQIKNGYRAQAQELLDKANN